MDHHDTNSQRNEDLPQQVYIIQLDPNIHIESQAIPLHILENCLDGNMILPLLQQKNREPLQLLIEPHSTEVTIEYQRSQSQNEITPNTQMMPIVPGVTDASTNVKRELVLNNTQDSALFNKQFKALGQPVAVKEPIVETFVENDEIKNVKLNKENAQKQKIKNFVHISDVIAPPRAIAVLPAILRIRGKWILPRRSLSSRIRFGPVQGIRKTITRLEASKLLSIATTPVFLLCQDEEHVIHIDVTDKDKSNWIGLLPLGEMSTPTTQSTANVWLYEESNQLYILTMQSIGPRTQLRLGYSKKYVEDHGIQTGPPVLDLETVNPVQWWCNECNRALASPALLQRHTDVYHKDEIKSSWPSYNCKHCRRSFTRLYTLRRHIISNCPKKSKEKNQISSKAKPEPDINTTLEDNRIPSDESFQNFTNTLDISTNLFDTDRIAGLDISGNSRADSDLNPYSTEFRDENGLSNDLGFTKLTSTPENVQSYDETTHISNKQLPDTCAYCSQIVVKKNKSKHLRQCPSRLICECGRVFRHKESLGQHIHKSHPSDKWTKTDKKKPEEEKEMAYKCQECPLGFKRRGMLVNHLWRVHKMISTMPVEKIVRHYPCVVCPKIYGSAAKRNRHMRVHHPGTEKLDGQSIEGGVKSCQPASCSECPRQYATRAKLLQHFRSHHPHLAKAIKKQEIDRNKQRNSDGQIWKNRPACNNTSELGIKRSLNIINHH